METSGKIVVGSQEPMAIDTHANGATVKYPKLLFLQGMKIFFTWCLLWLLMIF